MSQFDYYSNLDSHPFIGERKVSFKAKMSEKYLNPRYNQVKNVTRGKVYDIYKVEGYGDMVEFYFLDDTGKEQGLCDFFFEDISSE